VRRSSARVLAIAASAPAPETGPEGRTTRLSDRAARGLAAGLACGLLCTAAASAASGPPPPPKSPVGKTVTQVAAGGGLATPTSFAFGDGQVFEGDAGAQTSKLPNGGVFVLKNGRGDKLAGSPGYVSGLAWHGGSLYVAAGSLTGKTTATWTIQKWSGWNGTGFTSQTAIYTAPAKFQGFNGIAFGPDGRLYVGVAVQGTNNNDHGPANTSPYLYSILTMKDNGTDLKVFATGIRQPWQMAFAPGSKSPFVSALGQDKPAHLNPPDFVLKVRPGDNYGFPQCTEVVAENCKGYAKPFRVFAAHSDIMGMAIIGNRLYMTSFVGLHATAKSQGGEVLSMSLTGGKVSPVLTGFVAPTVGLGAHGDTLYVGELTGQVFSVQP
jgi:glucose/arabinose dehydrogenase